MTKEKIVIATIKSWNIAHAKAFRLRFGKKYDVILCSAKKELSYKKLKRLNPRFLFFPHWSWMISRRIYQEFPCVAFHMTDLPFGRGGSPLQNLIVRGMRTTKISALKVGGGIDAGPVYMKRPLSLRGNASAIFERASRIIFDEMIPHIITHDPQPVAQKGRVVKFKRRAPKDGSIVRVKSLEQVYDRIRMLDAEGYPSAFIDIGDLHIEFTCAQISGQCVSAHARIIKR